MNRGGVLRVAVKAAVTAGLAVVWFALYARTNALGNASPRALVFPPPTAEFPGLYQPWTAFVYVAAGYALPVLPLVLLARSGRYWVAVLAYALGGAAALVCYAALPVRMERRAYGGSPAGERLMRWVASLDEPANCLPSSHVLFAVAAAALVQSLLPGAAPLKRAVWAVAILVSLSTITVGQHYWVDVAAGAAVALASVWAARALASRLSSRDAAARPRGSKP